MRRSEVHRHMTEEFPHLALSQNLLETFCFVGIEIVEDEMDVRCAAMGLHAILPQKICRELGGSSWCHGDGARAKEWRDGNKQVPRAVPFVFIVRALVVSVRTLLHHLRPTRRGEELLGCLVKTVEFVTGKEWFRIERKDVIHPFTKGGREIGDAPHFFPAMASGHGG